MSLVHGIFSCLNRRWMYDHSGDSNEVYNTILAIHDAFSIVLYTFVLYLLFGSIRLLSKYAQCHS
jgi:hypothetical protein